MQRIEFTIEPFVEGSPGPHVTETITAVESLDVEVDVGPFGSSCNVEAANAADVVATIVRTAITNGASHVNVDVEQIETSGPDA